MKLFALVWQGKIRCYRFDESETKAREIFNKGWDNRDYQVREVSWEEFQTVTRNGGEEFSLVFDSGF